ncbi:MAG: non-hydrolyzing UDP-N-acetylglucosamine 2-epimerase [Desulfomicrobium sp.]
MSTIDLVTIIGARPQFVKAATVSRAIKKYNSGAPKGAHGIKETLIHTGQHYDTSMSQVFFNELGLDEPQLNLGVGSGPHGLQTGRMLEKIEEVLLESEPDAVLLYGDTNSTLAGALAASKLHVPIVHVEAGLRSFNKKMPEEINRILTDHVASLLFCPTQRAVDNLNNESIKEGVHLVGDVMFDSIKFYQPGLINSFDALESFGLTPGDYILATAHRPENTDDSAKLSEILSSFAEIAKTTTLILVLHPRTAGKMQAHGLASPAGVVVAPPLPYLSMLQLMQHAKAVVTDSGGMQKEAYFFGKPCLTIREETEWLETIEVGANTLAGSSCKKILHWYNTLICGEISCSNFLPVYGNGSAAEKIVEDIVEFFREAK